MRNAEHARKSPVVANGLFATLSGLLSARGSGAPSASPADATRAPSPRPLRLAFASASLIATAGLLSMGAAPAAAAGCPNEAIREAEGSAATALPDCRAYEQVSPVSSLKNGADAAGSPGSVQASPSGTSLSYFSLLPFAGVSAAETPRYLGSRSSSPAAWSYRGIYPSLEPGAVVFLKGLTEDDAAAVVEVRTEQPPLAPCEPEARVCDPEYARATAYLIDTETGAFHFLAEYPRIVELSFAGATSDDSRLLLETTAQLLPAAQPGVNNLYQWDASKAPAQRLSLLGRLPASEGGAAPAQGSLVTPGCGVGFFVRSCYTQHAISADGSRAFFTDLGSGRIYERLIQAEETVPVSPGPALFRQATPDGRFLFYTEAGGLYRFDTQTEATDQLAGPTANLLGVLGVSDDGATAYFAAEAALTGSEENEWGARAEEGGGEVNLYRWHQDGQVQATAFIAGSPDGSSWSLSYDTNGLGSEGPSGGQRSSRLTPDGAVLLFASSANITSYQSAGNTELYRYDSAAPAGAHLACVTCNPTGAAPVGGETRLESANSSLTATPVGLPYLTRNLSADGETVFFNTREALLHADTNGALDVYEWERPGAGSCAESSPAFSAQDAGCLFLLSTGTSPQPSYFGDASASGEDAFFFTRQPLVSQDTDTNVDAYDAHLGGGIAAQSPPASAPPCEAEACKPPVTTPSAASTPASESLIGSPNPAYCRSGFVRRQGTCVKKKTHRKHHHKRHHRRAGRNRGGVK